MDVMSDTNAVSDEILQERIENKEERNNLDVGITEEKTVKEEKKLEGASVSSEERNEEKGEGYSLPLDLISKKIDALNELFEKRIARTDYEEKVVDRMHSELQKYKEDMYSQILRPVLMDIIEIRDSIQKMSKAFSEKPEGEQSIPLKTFSDYAFDLQDILERNSIEIYHSEEGTTFEAIKQRIVKKVVTPVEELHSKVAESLSDGYSYQGKTLSPEKVAVYIFETKGKEEGAD